MPTKATPTACCPFAFRKLSIDPRDKEIIPLYWSTKLPEREIMAVDKSGIIADKEMIAIS